LKLKARDGRDPRDLAEMDLDSSFDDRRRRTTYVQTMFDVIAPGYDAFTRLFSFGMDKHWKADLISEAARRVKTNPSILDLACGTGDLGIALAQRTGSRFVIGLDLSWQMLSEVNIRVKGEARTFALVACDMLHLCIEDRSVDAITIGYGLRNTADPDLALAEIARVLRPGGILANLDFNRPANHLWKEMFLTYMWYAGRLAGWLWHREPATYGYLAPSIRKYMTISEFELALERAGFQLEWCAKRLGGAIGLHVASRLGIEKSR
jgi:demethylmenaquinone methyltransferase / 2-methoxy-6-polyprenyl-1,4-benzoquinol methylase